MHARDLGVARRDSSRALALPSKNSSRVIVALYRDPRVIVREA
jgi:hypothetical protein